MEFFSKRSRYWRFRPYFWPADARRLYLHYYKGANSAYLDEYKTTIQLRQNTEDFITLKEIFESRIYDVALPFTPKTILDAGANTGLATVFLKKKYPEASVACLEIEENNFTMLKQHTSTLTNVRCIKKGLYHKNCFLNVADISQNSNAYTVVETSTPNENSIEAITVDGLMKEMGWDDIDLLKMDIEGAEKEVFEGDVAAWLPHAKAMMIETHDRMKKGCSRALFDAIRDYNFDLLTSTTGTLVFVKATSME